MIQTKGLAPTSPWTALVDWPTEPLYRGTVFRWLKAAWPYESVVDFMLVDYFDSPSGFAIYVVTGYKAGWVLAHLPIEAKADGDVHAISASWLRTNWRTLFAAESLIEDVYLVENYSAQVRMDDAPTTPSRDLQV